MHIKSTKRLNGRNGHSWPADKRKRRRLHRLSARDLHSQGGGSIIGSVAHWHLQNARYYGR